MARKPEKNKPDRPALVYSTDPSFSPQREPEDFGTALPPEKQRLIVRIDRRQRKGKEVTLVEGFAGADGDLQALAKLLKTRCGTGGTAKDGEILIQGDVRDKVLDLLLQAGYAAKRGN